MKTSSPKPASPSWYIVDAAGLTLGRLSASIAHVLRGKHKPSWSPHMVMSDHIIVTNAKLIVLTGDKKDTKIYERHSGTLGHLSRFPASYFLKKSPELFLERSIRGMLPRNRLRKSLLKFLHVYAEGEHPHAAQKPQPLAPSRALKSRSQRTNQPLLHSSTSASQ